MAKKNHTARPAQAIHAAATPTPASERTIFDELGMTPEEVREDLIAQGMDLDAEVEKMRKTILSLSNKYAPKAAAEKRQEMAPFLRSFPMREEAVAAGAPNWIGAANAPARANLLQILGHGAPEDLAWVDVKGRSMCDVGIRDDDTLLVDLRVEPKHGDIVIAHLAGLGQVVKRLVVEPGQKPMLVSENPDFKPIVIEDWSDLQIQGVVVARIGLF